MRWIGRAAGIAAVLLVLLGVAGHAWLQTASGRQRVARWVESAMSVPGQTVVRLGAVEAGLPTRIGVAGVRIEDAAGPWLEAESARLVWRPLALLSGRLEVASLRLVDARLIRSPETPPKEERPSEPFRLPSLPVAVAVEDIDLCEIRLGPALLSEPVSLCAKGRLALGGSRPARTDLTVERTDTPGARATVFADWDPGRKTLDLRIAAAEPEDGLVARLAKLESRPPIALLAEGHGPLSDWRGRIEASAAGLAALTADLRVDHERDYALRAIGRADVGNLVDPALRPAVARGVGFNVDLRYGGGPLAVERAEIAMEGARLEASGRLDPATAAIDADLAVEVLKTSPLGPLLGPVSVDRLSASAQVSGRLDRPRAALTGSVEGVGLPKAALERIDWRARLDPVEANDAAAGGVRIAADGEVRGVRSDDAAVSALVGETAAWSFDATLDPARSELNVRSAEATGQSLALDARGIVGFGGGPTDALLTARVPDLAVLAAAVGKPLAGRAEVKASLRGTAPVGPLSGKITATLARLATGAPAVDALLAPDAVAETEYALNGQTLTVGPVDVQGPGLQGDGAVTLDLAAGTLQARYRLKAPTLAPLARALDRPMRGSAAIEGTAEGELNDPSVVAALRLDDADVGGLIVRSATANVIASRIVSAPQGRVSIGVRADDLAGTARAAFAIVERQAVRIRDVSVEAPGLSLIGDVTAPLGGGIYRGWLSGRFAAPDGGVALAGHRARGRADIDVRLEAAGGSQTVAVTANARHLVVTGQDGAMFGVKRLRADANAADLFGKPKGGLALSLTKAAYGGVSIDALDARLEGAPTDARFRARIEGPAGRSGRLQTRGTLALRDGQTRLVVDALSGRIGTDFLSLAGPVSVEAGRGRAALGTLDLRIDEGRLTADGTVAPGATRGRVAASGVPLALADIVWPNAAVQGRVDATVEVRTERAGLGGDLDLRVRSASVGVAPKPGASSSLSPGLPPMNGTLTARWTGGIVSAESRVDGLPGKGGLSFSGQLPFAVDARSLQPTPNPAAPIAGRLTGGADVGPLWEALPFSDHRLIGRADVDVAVAGTLRAPRITGNAGLSGGTYEHLTVGTLIQELSVAATADGGGPVLLRLSGTDGGVGRVAGEGRIAPPGPGAMEVNVSVTMDQATLVRRDDATATASGRIDYSDTGAERRLTGHVETSNVELRLVDRLPPAVVPLEVTEVNRSDGPTADANERGRSDPVAAAPVNLDLALAMPRRVFVRGRGLQSEWSGRLAVNGTTDSPRVVGVVELVRGDFDIAGKRFGLQRGVLRFAGGNRIDPWLDIVAERSARQVTAILTVSGTASQPSFRLSSRPPLPESEILAQVLFNKAMAKLGPVEAVQVAAAVDALARGEGVTGNVLGSIRTLLGLDVLTVGAGESGGQGPTVGVGRYIGDRIYVGAEQGAAPGSGQGKVEVEIAPGVSLQSDVGRRETGTAGSLGLKWRWDY